MKVILLTSILIDFLIQRRVFNSVTGTTKISGLFFRNQMHRPILLMRRKKDQAKPNYGYEPYWENNDWVFSRHVTTAKGNTVRANCTPMPCTQMHLQYGEVCGRNRLYAHKTFPNYCELQNADCSEDKNMQWLIAYRGKCMGDLKTYPTKKASLVTRAEEYIKKFNDSLTTKPKPTLPPAPSSTPGGK